MPAEIRFCRCFYPGLESAKAAENFAKVLGILRKIVPKKPPPPTDEEIRQRLIEAGVKHLTEWGLVGVTSVTILSNQVNRAFFDSMLEETARDARRHGRYIIERAVKALRQEIATHVPEKVRNRRRKNRSG